VLLASATRRNRHAHPSEQNRTPPRPSRRRQTGNAAALPFGRLKAGEQSRTGENSEDRLRPWSKPEGSNRNPIPASRTTRAEPCHRRGRSRRFTGYGAPLRPRKPPRIRPPDPLESSTIRGHQIMLPRLDNQMFGGTRGTRSCHVNSHYREGFRPRLRSWDCLLRPRCRCGSRSR
jgi:hypothetical protein